MDPKRHSGSDHVVNITSQEQELNIPGTPGHRVTSEVVGSANGPNTEIQEPQPTDANANTPVPPTLKIRPDRSLLSGNREEYMEFCLPLYEAAITGDWEAAKLIFDRHPELVRFAITSVGNITLHLAVLGEATKQNESFVENLVEMMEIEDLEIQNDRGVLAYMIAAAKGHVNMFKVILNKNKDILSMFPQKTLLALDMSASNGSHDMTLHFNNVLEKSSLSFWGEFQWCSFFISCVDGDLFDIALKVLEDHLIIGTSFRTCFTTLHALARRPDAINRTETDTYMTWRFAYSILPCFHVKKNSPEVDDQALKLVQSLLKLYPKSSQHDILGNFNMPFNDKNIQEMGMTPRGLLFTAAEMGNTKFVIELVRMFTNIIFETKAGGISIFHIAIMHRNIGLYNLLYETGSHHGPISTWLDNKNNNILHLVAKTSKDTTQLQTVSGASLLMQRELLWYKEVEKMVTPSFRNLMNDDGETPYKIFSENNKELVSKGLKWTKDCMVVATLIITVAFAVAYTVPGGYNQETGIPIFHHDPSFLVFIIADAFSLFTSSTSLLVFLSILTSPHGQRDFLYAMPRKLMIGLVTLFMSVVGMMVTFAASFFVLYENTYKWLPIVISVFAATPVTIFAALQYPFVMDMYRSMFDSSELASGTILASHTQPARIVVLDGHHSNTGKSVAFAVHSLRNGWSPDAAKARIFSMENLH